MKKGIKLPAHHVVVSADDDVVMGVDLFRSKRKADAWALKLGVEQTDLSMDDMRERIRADGYIRVGGLTITVTSARDMDPKRAPRRPKVKAKGSVARKGKKAQPLRR